MSHRKKSSSEKATLRKAGTAMNRAEARVEDAAEAMAAASSASDEPARRAALVDMLEGLMDASYQLGVAEVHLKAAGYADPLKVPRFDQVVEGFAVIWEGALARRVANPSERAIAALTAGATSVAGAAVGGVLGGPVGALLGSVAGGAIGPTAFMRDSRAEDRQDAALGGGVGGIFTPVGAAALAYLAVDEQDLGAFPLRVRNMDASSTVDRINDALENKDWETLTEAAEDLFQWIQRGGSPPERLIDWRLLERAHRNGRLSDLEYSWLMEINILSNLEYPMAERWRHV